MLHRIVVDVIEVLSKVVGITDRVLPISFEPDAADALAATRYGSELLLASASKVLPRKGAFDLVDPNFKIRIVLRQGKQEVYVVGKKYNCIDLKWMIPSTVRNRFMKYGSRRIVDQDWGAILRDER
jgi:hypothetical protein